MHTTRVCCRVHVAGHGLWEGKADPAHQTLHAVTPGWLTSRAERKKYDLEVGTLVFLTRARFLPSLKDPRQCNPLKRTPDTCAVKILELA